MSTMLYLTRTVRKGIPNMSLKSLLRSIRSAPDQSNNEEETNTEKKEEEDTSPPEPEDKSRTLTENIYEATIHYDNGDTNVIECYGELDRDEETIQLAVNPELRDKDNWFYAGPLSYESKMLHVAYLSREPELEKVKEEIWEIEWREINGNVIYDSMEVERRQDVCTWKK